MHRTPGKTLTHRRTPIRLVGFVPVRPGADLDLQRNLQIRGRAHALRDRLGHKRNTAGFDLEHELIVHRQ